jgi:asparagine synthase (glutamine-hydrolysing)
MCGIWAYISKIGTFYHKDVDYYTAFNAIKKRGPDRSRYIEINCKIPMKIGFHRLSITDLSTRGDQPFVFEMGTEKEKTVYCLTNGEIYNYKKLIIDHNLSPVSGSDCEVVPLLYMKYGFEKTISLLLGEWALIVIEIDNPTGDTLIYAARDEMGVRPMFYSSDVNGYSFSSEMKGLLGVSQKINVLPPTYFARISITKRDKYISTSIDWREWYTPSYTPLSSSLSSPLDTETIESRIRELVTEAVETRLESRRPIACLLSGGIDSSLVAAIAAKYMQRRGEKIRTFSIGMPDSPDVYYAQKVADYIGSIHTVVPFDPIMGIKSIPRVIKCIESYDITTVRASTPHFLLVEWIRENTDVKVIYSGEYMDELAGSYLYMHKAPSPEEFHSECVRLVKDIYLFDSLRADRCIAGNGIEARVPFSHRPLVEFYLSLDAASRIPRPSPKLGISENLEKALVREAFADTGLLPLEIISRTKNAFSDAVSHESKSWYRYIEDYTDISISDDEFSERSYRFPLNTPKTKESFYFRMWFETEFGAHNADTIPYMWLPKWCGDITNPSARVLDVYSEGINRDEKREERD